MHKTSSILVLRTFPPGPLKWQSIQNFQQNKENTSKIFMIKIKSYYICRNNRTNSTIAYYFLLFGRSIHLYFIRTRTLVNPPIQVPWPDDCFPLQHNNMLWGKFMKHFFFTKDRDSLN